MTRIWRIKHNSGIIKFRPCIPNLLQKFRNLFETCDKSIIWGDGVYGAGQFYKKSCK